MNYYLDPDFELDGKKNILDQYISNFEVLIDLEHYAKTYLNIKDEDSKDFAFTCLGMKNNQMKYSEVFRNNYLPLRFQNIIMVQIELIIRKLKMLNYLKIKLI